MNLVPGVFFPYSSLPYRLVSPSPTPSVCSEPAYQVTLSNSGYPSHGIQMTTPSYMSPAMIDATGRNNMNAHLPTPVVQPGMTQVGLTPSYCFLQSDSAQSDYTLSNNPVKQTNLGKSLQPHTLATDKRRKDLSEQEQQNTGSVSSGWGRSTNPTHLEDDTIKVYVTAQDKVSVSSAFNQAQAKDGRGSKSDRSGSESDRNHGVVRRKKQLIQTAWNLKKELMKTGCSKKKVIKPAKDVKMEKEEPMEKSRDVNDQAIRKCKLQVRKQRKKLQKKNKSLQKTELCTRWTLNSACSFKGKCYFAHGINELKKRSRVGNYKTQPCVKCSMKDSHCVFGSRCKYCHPGETIRRVVGSTYYDKNYYKDLKKEFSTNDYPFGIFV